ncbi:MAG: outer membrane beta-barrel protein [Bacteroidales bacterium]|nr:outer membrane beta-barrel protein [Bacteroidales bacterium]
MAEDKAYRAVDQTVELVPGNNILFVEMTRKPQSLQGVTVTAETPSVTFRKDTVVFNASAVNVLEGESALEILRQMPGVEIRRGKIRIHGKEVKRTYVNGVLIYGDNAMTPLNALLAQEVVNIKSYEELSVKDRRRKARHGKKETVLDIATRNPVHMAFDGHFSAGAGSDMAGDIKYKAGVVGNLFSEKLLLYGDAYTNNIGSQDNSFHPAGVTPGSLRSQDRKISAGTGIQKYWGDRMMGSNIKADYKFSSDKVSSHSRVVKDFFSEGDESRAYDIANTDKSSTMSHSAGAFLTLNNEKIKSLSVSQTVDFTRLDKESDLRTMFHDRLAGDNTKAEINVDHSRQWSLGGDIVWSNDQNPKGWFPMLGVGYKVSNSMGTGARIDTLASSLNRRFITLENTGLNSSFSATAACTAFLLNNEKMTMTGHFGYGFGWDRHADKQIALDTLDPEMAVTDLVNTYDFTWNIFRHAAMAAVQMSLGQTSVNLGGELRFNRLMDIEVLPAGQRIDKLYVTPAWDGDFSGPRWSMTYSMEPSIPSLEQARARIDNSDQLFQRAGNPDLKPAYNHQLSVGYAFPKVGRSGSLRISLESTAATSVHVMRTRYFSDASTWKGYGIPAGTTLQTWENAPVSTNTSLRVFYSLRLQKMKSTVSLSAYSRYATRPEYIGDNLLVRRETTPGLRGSIDWRPNNKTRVMANASFEYVDSRSKDFTLRAIRPHAEISAFRSFGKSFFLSGSYHYTASSYLGGAMDSIHLHSLHTVAGARLLKGMLVISLSANDLLAKDTGYTLVNGVDSRIQTWKPSLGRYFMLNVQWRLNKMKTPVEFRGSLSR